MTPVRSLCRSRYNACSLVAEPAPVPTILHSSNLSGLELLHRGKVRDVYALQNDRLLIVATDRLSAFDVVLPDPIPGKGEMLTQISNFWFGKTAHLVPNHLTGVPVADVLPSGTDVALYARRAVVAKRLKAVPIEAIARGYLIGSGWKDYQATGSLCGIRLPAGLRQADRLPEPIFTPSTKAPSGSHDENIGFDAVVQAIGTDLAEQVRGHARDLHLRGEVRSGARHHHRRHQVRVRHRRGRQAVRDGRDADAGFLALLAGGPIPRRHQSAELRQAVRAQLPGNTGLEQARARPQAAAVRD